MELTFLKLRKKYVISEKKGLNDNNSHLKLKEKALNSQYSGASLKLQNKNSQFLSLTIISKP